jgi:hypothetical protein
MSTVDGTVPTAAEVEALRQVWLYVNTAYCDAVYDEVTDSQSWADVETAFYAYEESRRALGEPAA